MTHEVRAMGLNTHSLDPGRAVLKLDCAVEPHGRLVNTDPGSHPLSFASSRASQVVQW